MRLWYRLGLVVRLPPYIDLEVWGLLSEHCRDCIQGFPSYLLSGHCTYIGTIAIFHLFYTYLRRIYPRPIIQKLEEVYTCKDLPAQILGIMRQLFILAT